MCKSETDGQEFSGIEHPYRDESILRELYIEREHTIAEISEILSCSSTTVGKYIQEFGIETRPTGGRPVTCPELRDKELMRELYREQGLTQVQIADRYGVTQTLVSERIHEHKLELSPEEAGRKSGLARRQKHPTIIIAEGYEQIWHTVDFNEGSLVPHHRLLAVAEFGFEAIKDMHVHHRNHLSWDNRPGNLELLTPREHARHHLKGGEPVED